MVIKFGNEYTAIIFEKEENNSLVIKEISCFGKKYVNATSGLAHSIVYIIGRPYVGADSSRHNRVGEIVSYYSHQEIEEANKKQLIITETNESIVVKTVYVLYKNCAVLECYKEVTNITESQYTLSCVCPLALTGFFKTEQQAVQAGERSAYREEIAMGTDAEAFSVSEQLRNERSTYLWRAHNTWCAEACFERTNLRNEGFRRGGIIKKCGRIVVSNDGVQTTNRYLPMGILEQENFGLFMFEIVAEGSWSYEMEMGARDFDDGEIYLCLTGKTYRDNMWYKILLPQETYKTDKVRIVGGEDFDVLGEHITLIRRATRKWHKNNAEEKVVYNNFMHNTFGWSNEKDDEVYIPLASEYGADYYVLDAGWHDYAENGRTPTHEIGEWQENTINYPNGLKRIEQKVRSYGMKFGLWVELQSVGYYCQNKKLLPEECFFHINGVRPVFNCRYQLDYTKKQVRDYADGIIKELVEKYKPDYIKIDYNQSQLATFCLSGSPTEGVALHCRAYNEWFNEIQNKYPDIMFESCSSGGMRNDEKTVELASVVSISDQGTYYNYPYIVANMALSLLPEQCGVWNIPIRKPQYPITSDEEVIMNSINSFYGAMHLCSKIDALSDNQKSLVKEGIAYYRSLGQIKKRAYPVFLNGVTRFDDEIVFAALRCDKKLYVSVYNLTNETKNVKQDISKYKARRVQLVYPKNADNEYEILDDTFVCCMKPISARSFEFDLE